MNACVRYISIVSERPEALAEFYAGHLGMRELGRGPEGDISLTDGFYNLTFLKQRPGLEADDRLGLNHFGLEIEDIREVEARLE
ncbi:MAG: VOC family protein, partial [Chloroflexota bacterium]